MASINLTGTLRDSLGEIDVGAVITWTHLSTTGETLATTKVETVIPPDGSYNINVEYGRIRIDYKTNFTERFVGEVTIDANSVATSIPQLLSATTPANPDVIVQMQAIEANAVAAQNGVLAAEAVAVAAATSATNSAESVGGLIYKLSNPKTHILKRNLPEYSMKGVLDVSRASSGGYVDEYGGVVTEGDNTLREVSEGFLIESTATNFVPNSEALAGVGLVPITLVPSPGSAFFTFSHTGNNVPHAGGSVNSAELHDASGIISTILPGESFTFDGLNPPYSVRSLADFTEDGLTQVEAGMYATSPISTPNAAGTRVAVSVLLPHYMNMPKIDSDWSISFRSKLTSSDRDGINTPLYIITMTASDSTRYSISYWDLGEKINVTIGGSGSIPLIPNSRLKSDLNYFCMTHEASTNTYRTYCNGIIVSTKIDASPVEGLFTSIKFGDKGGIIISDFRCYDSVLVVDEIKFLGEY